MRARLVRLALCLACLCRELSGRQVSAGNDSEPIEHRAPRGDEEFAKSARTSRPSDKVLAEREDKWDWEGLVKHVLAKLVEKNETASTFFLEPPDVARGVRIARIGMKDLRSTLRRGIYEQLSSHVRPGNGSAVDRISGKTLANSSVANARKIRAQRPRELLRAALNVSGERNDGSVANGTASREDTNDMRRKRRYSRDLWIEQNFEGHDNLLQIQALVVRDEEIAGCQTPANDVTKTRYFMCSGAILTERHVITTASCMHYAHVYEHHVDAELAVLLGAFYEKSYVIRIERFEMHPQYVYDLDSPLYAVHNLAIVFLECPIPRAALTLPRIPMDEFEDVGHLCCPQTCEMMTIVQKFNNRHEARLLKPLHLPLPTHEKYDDADFVAAITESPYKRPCRRRESRSPAKLAPTPVFFVGERKSRDQNSRIGKAARRESVFPLTGSQRKFVDSELEGLLASLTSIPNNVNDESPVHPGNAEGSKVGNENAMKTEGNEERIVPVDLVAIEKASMAISDNIPSIGKQAVSMFTKNVVDVALRKLNEILDEDVGTQYFEKNMSMDSIADVLVRTIITTTLEDLNITHNQLDQLNSIEPPLDKYQKCPPLGTPVVIEDVLVGLVAYSCDDLQDWVPWRYVSLSKNVQWIRDKISETPAQEEESLPIAANGFKITLDSLDEEQRPEDPTSQDSKASPSPSKTNVDINECLTDEQGVTRCTTKMVISQES